MIGPIRDGSAYYIKVPSSSVNCDISISALEDAIQRYEEEYRERPQVLLYSSANRGIILELFHACPYCRSQKDEEMKWISRIRFLQNTLRPIEIPGLENHWLLVGKLGLFISTGA